MHFIHNPHGWAGPSGILTRRACLVVPGGAWWCRSGGTSPVPSSLDNGQLGAVFPEVANPNGWLCLPLPEAAILAWILGMGDKANFPGCRGFPCIPLVSLVSSWASKRDSYCFQSGFKAAEKAAGRRWEYARAHVATAAPLARRLTRRLNYWLPPRIPPPCTATAARQHCAPPREVVSYERWSGGVGMSKKWWV